MNEEYKEEILDVQEGGTSSEGKKLDEDIHSQQTEDVNQSDEISFEDVNEERSRSEKRQRDPKLASEGL